MFIAEYLFCISPSMLNVLPQHVLYRGACRVPQAFTVKKKIGINKFSFLVGAEVKQNFTDLF